MCFFPNPGSTLFLMMYSDVFILTIIPTFDERTLRKLVLVVSSLWISRCNYRSLVDQRSRDFA
jgi:hypothetical protein